MAIGADPNDGKRLSPELEKLKTEQPDIFQAAANYFVGVGKGEIQRQLEEIRTEKQKLITQLEEQVAKLNDGDAEKERLRKQIGDLESQVLTRQELAEKRLKETLEQTQNEARKNFEKAQAETKKAAEESAAWKGRYVNYYTENEILKACSQPETTAFYPPQVIANLKPHTRVEPVVDFAGNETGEYRVVIALPDEKEGGKLKDYNFNDGFKMWSEKKENDNLFRGRLPGGSANGTQRLGPGQTISAAQLGDMATYIQNREQILQKQ